MLRSWLLTAGAAAAMGALVAIPVSVPAPVRANPAAPDQNDERKKLDRKIEDAVDRGLEYLKKTQAPDGHWEAQGGQYPTSMTALAGMCFLMEGSTLREGKYTEQVDKAVKWFLAPGRQQPNGLLGAVQNPTEATRYMYGQGFGTMFLASVYGEEEDNDQRKKLEAVLKKAVQFIADAQTSKQHARPEGKRVEIGGWGYVSAKDGNQFDEGSVTITQLQALRAAKNAGIPVPKETIDKAVLYLEACTTPKGGVIYSYAGSGGAAMNGQERPPLTVAAISCSFSAGQYKSDLAKKWIKFCKDNIPIARGRVAHDEYQSYYFSQAVYILGDDRYGELFDPEGKDKRSWLTWSRYKYGDETDPNYPNGGMYRHLLDSQDKSSGAWTSGYIGTVFSTSVNLTILQLQKGILPIYQR